MNQQPTKDKLGHCSKCGKRSITICIPCALRMRDEAIEKITEKWYLAKVKEEIIKQINKAEKKETDWEDMYEDLRDFINNL